MAWKTDWKRGVVTDPPALDKTFCCSNFPAPPDPNDLPCEAEVALEAAFTQGQHCLMELSVMFPSCAVQRGSHFSPVAVVCGQCNEEPFFFNRDKIHVA